MTVPASTTKEAPEIAPTLETRHVFLDTQVYRKLKHNPANPALRALAAHVEQHRLVLHITDVTLREIERQLEESVAARARELVAIEKDLVRWRHAAPKTTPKKQLELDAGALASDLFRALRSTIMADCRATLHKAMDIPPIEIFDAYFRRVPPFDEPAGKEFPDAFAVRALERWCAAKGERMYVVTADKAMTRAAEASPQLIALADIQSLLRMASAGAGDDAEKLAEALIGLPAFDEELRAGLATAIHDAIFIYAGDLPEGEAYQGELVDIIAVRHWDVIGRFGGRLSLTMDVEVIARIEVQYEDRSEAMYDSEDGRWIGTGTETTEVETEVDLPVYVELDTISGRITDIRTLDEEVSVHEPYETFK